MSITNKDILTDVKKQLTETLKRVNIALRDIEANPERHDFYGSKTFASAKRSAMDLKNELTKLTQSSKYKYNR